MKTNGKRVAFIGFFLLCTAVALSAQPTGLRVAIYSGMGADSTTILAMFRAVASIGDSPMAITTDDILNGRLTRANFDVLIIPPGEDGSKCCADHYSDGDALDKIATKAAMRSYLNSGGGIVAEEAAAYYASQNGGTFDVYLGKYTNVTNQVGKTKFTIVNSQFGTGQQEVWQSAGGGYFPAPPSVVTVIATDGSKNPTIVSQAFGVGRLILTSYVLELRGDTNLDWTIWDNWAMGGVHNNSVGVWQMLGRMIGWAYNGNSSLPTVNPAPLPPGVPVAVIAQHTSDGGAWPGLLPGVARSIEYAGHVPLAIRFQEVISGKLTTSNFKVVVFPGGDAYGYKTGLSGYEGNVRNFISSGGSYFGICAGSYYAASSIVWLGRTYSYPLGIFKGQDIGAVSDIAPWPGYALTTLNVSGDSVIGNLGPIHALYYGGGYHTIPADSTQGSHVYSAASFTSGSASGRSDLVRYSYGSGKVALSTTHPEALVGYTDDWMYWDNYLYSSTASATNPDADPHSSWNIVKAVFNNWLTK